MLEVFSPHHYNSSTGQNQILMMPSTLMSPSMLMPQSSGNLTSRHVHSPAALSFVPPSIPEGKRAFSQDDSGEQARVEEHENRSGKDMEGGSGEDQDAEQPPRKKRYHRHNANQIQQLEAFFKECAHPDEKQRQELSEALGLSIRQVKFWFQNRRTQMKAQQERTDNAQLRAENDRLRTENITIREAIKSASCPTCGGASGANNCFDDQQLRIENTRLREELERVTTVATRYLGRPLGTYGGGVSSMPTSSLELAVGGGGSSIGGGQGPTLLEIALRPGGLSDMEKGAVLDLAANALEELLQMVQAEEPMWTKGSTGGGELRLDYDQYVKQFPGGIGPHPVGLSSEASIDTGLIIMNSAALMDALMDAAKWMEMFPTIVSKALTVEVLSPGIGSTLDGSLKLMYAELQVLSPLVQTRELYFVRYCKQAADKIWAIVDVSIDCLRDKPPPCLLQCRRRPSGCLVQEMPNGYSQVTWLEHVEADHRNIHRMYRPLVSSGIAFGAKRWLCSLQRYCESVAALLATNIPARDLGVVNSLEGRRCMLRLALKMTHRYCSNVSASSSSSWLSLPNNNGNGASEEDVRVMIRDNPGDGVLLCAAASMWLPYSRHRVFDFLRNERYRAQWDVLANGATQEMCHIAKGQHPGNTVSLLRVNGSNPSQSNVLILQESCTDDASSLVVYMPVDFSTLTTVLQGEDPSDVLLLPSGFVIVPDGPENRPSGFLLGEGNVMDTPPAGGSLLTVSFQIAVSHVPSSGKLNMESVNTVSKIIVTTLQHIKSALQRWDG